MTIAGSARGDRQRLTRNSAYSLAGAGGAFLIALAATPTLVHRLGPADYGLWSIALAAFGLMNVLEFGLGTAVAKYVAEHSATGQHDDLSATISIAVTAYLGVGLLLTVPLFLLAPDAASLFGTAQSGRTIETVLRIVSLGLFPMLLLSCGQAFAVGLQDFKLPMLASLAQSAGTILTALAIVGLGGSVVAVTVGSLVVLWVAGLATFFAGLRMIRRVGGRVRFARGYARPMLGYVAFTGLTGMGALLFGSVDRLVVGAVVGLRGVAVYSVTIGIANKILYVADVACRPLMPASSALDGAGQPATVLAYLRRATVAVGLATFVGAGLLFVLSDPFLRWWLGDAFARQALEPFRIFIVVYALLALAAPAYHVINGVGLAWMAAAVTMVGGTATLVLIALLGDAHGIVGAALANGAYCVNLLLPLLAIAALRRRVPDGTWNVSNAVPAGMASTDDSSEGTRPDDIPTR
jgi:O-antigen/teichoic acid export membrane protein